MKADEFLAMAVISAFLVLVCAYLHADQVDRREACKQKGGQLVKSSQGLICMKGEVIK